MERTDATFEEVAAAHYPRLVRRLTLIVRDPHEAQDLAQATLLTAHEAWPTLNGADVGGWLQTVGLRLALNEVRRRRRRPWRSFVQRDEALAKAATADPDLWEALGELRPAERAALVLNVLDGYTQAEIADQLGVPAGTVASWIARSKARVRARLRAPTLNEEA